MEANDSEPKIEFTDKRRVRADAVEPEPSGPPPEAPESAERTEGTEGVESDGATGDAPFEAVPADEETAHELPNLDVYGLLQTTVGLLANGAWAWMGLTPNPFTGKMERDLSQAKIAIDTVAFLVTQLEPSLSAEDRRELQNLVSMLRINYVQQTQA